MEVVAMTGSEAPRAFNSPLESGTRAVCVLYAAYPNAFDLDRLVALDHLVVHSADAGGPRSLHPSLPLRSTELLVRRELVERGLLLMASRGLIERLLNGDGVAYRAGESAATFVSAAMTPYLTALMDRSQWAVDAYGPLDERELRQKMDEYFGNWIEHFENAKRFLEVDE